MRWPWVSRAAFEIVVEERNRLREREEALQEALIRLARKGSGMPEEPRAQRKEDPMPEDVRELVEMWDSQMTRDRLMEDAWKMYRRVGDWGPVREMLSGA